MEALTTHFVGFGGGRGAEDRGPPDPKQLRRSSKSDTSQCGSSTIRSAQGAPWTDSKVSLRLTTGRNEPKRLSGSTIRTTSRAAAVRHICSGAWPTSVDKPTSRPRCRPSHIRQSSAGLAGSESGEVGRSSLPDCRGSPCINVRRAVKSLVSSIANSTAGLDSARRSVRRSSCVSSREIRKSRVVRA